MSSGPEKSTFRDRAHRWFLRACWDRYRALLVGTMDLEWATLPADTMLKWQPNDNDRYILQRSEGKIRVSMNNQKHFAHFRREVATGCTCSDVRCSEVMFLIRQYSTRCVLRCRSGDSMGTFDRAACEEMLRRCQEETG
ncbi:hypothetical protein PENSPDRAFT_319898 [Peniophora sp. CONT]|nr:hypothetical protein PENSPDRAFT_319898 [Peniophora sp. CONT]